MSSPTTEHAWLQRSIWRDGQIGNNTFKTFRDVFVFFLLFGLFAVALIVGLSAAFFSDESDMAFTTGIINIWFQLK